MPYAELLRGRWSSPDGVYLLTTATARRRPLFMRFAAAWIVAREIHRMGTDGGCTLLAWVIMPDHVHVMLTLGPDSLATVMRNLKGRSSRALGKRFGIVERTWAPGYHDHALRRTDDVAAVARYVVANPLRAQLVRRLGDYPFWNARWVGGEQG